MPGYRVQSLGVMRYLPVASAAYLDRYLWEGFTREAVAAAPSIAWNRDDALQDILVRTAFRRAVTRSVHYVPTAEGFGAAVRAVTQMVSTTDTKSVTRSSSQEA